MQTGYLELTDDNLYYEDSATPHNQGTLVLSHAGFLDCRMWDDQWEAFRNDYRVIRYDMAGFGQSAPVTGPRARRDDLYRLLQYLQVDSAHLLGCSIGGEIVLDLALEHPEIAVSLILVNSVPSGFEMQGEPPQYLFEMMAAMQAGDVDTASELQLRLYVDGPQRQPDAVNPEARQRATAMNRAVVASQTWMIADVTPLRPLDPPAVERLGTVDIPTLIITGALDHVETLRAGDLMASAIPGARQMCMDNTAHVPNLEDAATFNQSVLDFLSTLPVA
ncbi:MAG: alpha/beta hydrolase [Caldilineaceae bacterium]|nr:alpha/beta hydrolase [Caldilineaceae bacterium]